MGQAIGGSLALAVGVALSQGEQAIAYLVIGAQLTGDARSGLTG